MDNIWQGRNDGDSPLHHRIFQRVEIAENYENILPNNFVLHGFAVDEGVRRNKGRVGALSLITHLTLPTICSV